MKMEHGNEWQCEGFDASEAGKPISACPYATFSPEWYWWRAGWDFANTDRD